MTDAHTLDNPRVVIGNNNPPDPFGAVKAHIDDLLVEARNWADGSDVETQAQADELSFLIDQLRKAHQAGDTARKTEKQPHDDAARAVQERYRPILEACQRAEAAAKATLSRWLLELDRQQRAAAEEARRAAERAAADAAMAHAVADDGDLASLERVDATIANAEELAKGAKAAESAKAQAKGGARAMSLRSYFTPEIEDAVVAARHYWEIRRQDMEAALLELARRDVAAGRRSIPGFKITEEWRAV